MDVFDSNGEYMPIDAICNAEGRYVEAHPEIQAPNWIASKEEFIDRYENISEGGFKAFYTRTRPFSEHAGKVLFERWADGHQGPLADIIELFEDDELDYLKSCAKKPNAHSWDTSRELFRQCLDKTSPAFADHRLKIWGAVRNAEEETINRLPDGSALLTFTTLGGSADNVIKELSRQHPMLAFAHSWICEGNPQYNGAALLPVYNHCV